MKFVRIKRDRCDNQFKTYQTLTNHLEYFHRIHKSIMLSNYVVI